MTPNQSRQSNREDTTTTTDEATTQTHSPRHAHGDPITGRAVGWLIRTPDGAIVNGSPYPLGRHLLLTLPEDEEPSQLLDTPVTGTVEGSFTHTPDTFDHDVPAEDGTYVLVQPTD